MKDGNVVIVSIWHQASVTDGLRSLAQDVTTENMSCLAYLIGAYGATMKWIFLI